METVRLIPGTVDAVAAKAAAIIRRGGVVVFPTDTLYGLGADALSDDAVEKIYAIKGREGNKAIHAIVADLAMADRYGIVTDEVKALGEKFPTGQVTRIVRKRSISTGIGKGIETFGFRIPNNEFCIALARAVDGPITATSANKSGGVPLLSVPGILAQLGESSNTIDLAVDAGELPPSKPSTVIDLSHPASPRILREGAISADEILRAVRP